MQTKLPCCDLGRGSYRPHDLLQSVHSQKSRELNHLTHRQRSRPKTRRCRWKTKPNFKEPCRNLCFIRREHHPSCTPFQALSFVLYICFSITQPSPIVGFSSTHPPILRYLQLASTQDILRTRDYEKTYTKTEKQKDT